MTLDGNRVRGFLKTNGKTNEWLAVQLGCSYGTIARLLGGRLKRAELLVKLAQVMGCQVEDLITPQAESAKRTA